LTTGKLELYWRTVMSESNVFNFPSFIGIKVKSPLFGNGTIEELKPGVECVGVRCCEGRLLWFTKDGRYDSYLPILSFGHYPEDYEHDYGTVPWIADWTDTKQKKYHLAIDPVTGNKILVYSTKVQYVGVEYMSKEEAKALIEVEVDSSIDPDVPF